MDSVKTLDKVGDDLIDRIRTTQDWTLSAIDRLSRALSGISPNLKLALPVDLHRVREFAESVFRFRQRLVENQREVALKFLEAIEKNIAPARKAA